MTEILLSSFNETVECVFRNVEAINVSNDSISAFISHVINVAGFLNNKTCVLTQTFDRCEYEEVSRKSYVILQLG